MIEGCKGVHILESILAHNFLDAQCLVIFTEKVADYRSEIAFTQFIEREKFPLSYVCINRQ